MKKLVTRLAAPLLSVALSATLLVVARPGVPTAAAAPSPSVVTCATATLARLGTAARVGQLFMFGVPGTILDSTTASLIQANQFGSVFLENNRTGGVAAVRGLTNAIQALAPGYTAGIPFFVAADQEGGYVQRLTGPGFSTIPTALSQGGLSAATLQADATVWGRQLAAAGVNLDLAPVMDVVPPGFDASNPPIGQLQREYGHDPATVGTHGTAFLRGLSAAGVATTLKHFPGLGRVTGNTDTTAGVTDTITTSTDPYLASFQAGISAGADFVMMSLATYTRIDASHIAAFSPAIVTTLLRGKLGFTGVVVSDSLSAAAVSSMDSATRAVSFVNAGGDMLLIGGSTAANMAAALRSRADADAAFKAKIYTAALHVLEAKAARGLLACGTTTATATVRTGPSTSNAAVTTLALGTVVAVAGRTVQDASGRTWVPIETAAGKSGYVASVYVRYSGSAYAAGGLNLRSGPSTGASVVAVLPAGTLMSITTSTTDSLGRTWLAVRTGLGNGYVASWVTTP